MAGGFLRSAAAFRRCHSDFKQQSITHRFYNPQIVRNQIESHIINTPPPTRSYFGFPNFFKRSKECDLSYSTLVVSTFSSSSASTTKAGFIGWYLGMIKSHPIFTKSVTSSLVYAAADLSSQTIAKPFVEPYDFVRTLRMAGYGMLILGPSLHFWFNFMSKVFPKRDLITTFKKMAMGQGVYGPAMTVVFFSLNARLQGENGSEIIARLKRDFLPTMINGVMYWPICDFITFRFVPVQLQPLVSNSFSYLWTVYMTYMASLDKADAVSS